jgi:hypothetical protein
VICKECGRDRPKFEMIGRRCYLCVLDDFPVWPHEHRRYKKAVAIALTFGTPLTYKQALKLVKIVYDNKYNYNYEKMRIYRKILDGDFVDKNPGNTFYKRCIAELRGF